jgi:integrase
MQFLTFARQVLDQREEDGVRGTGRERSRFRVHIAPASFALKDLADVTANDIRDWHREMQRKRAKDARGERKLSRATICRSHSLVSAICGAAVERGLLEHNPCTGVPVKRRADESSTKDPWAWLKIEEQRAIAKCTAIPYADGLAIRFALATGLCQGEQFNLEVVDLHVVGDDPHVHVRYGSKGHKPPKSGKPRRVPLFGDGLAVAREQLAYIATLPNPEGLVFPSPRGRRRQEGKPLGPGGQLKKYLAVVGIERRVRWHDLRHTCATNLVTGVLGRRWTLEEIQPLMGHSSIQITQRYAHVGEDALKRAARETTAAAVPAIAAGISVNDNAIPVAVEAVNDNAGSWLSRVVGWIAKVRRVA